MDIIGSYKLDVNDNINYNSTYVTVVDPAMGMLEIEEMLTLFGVYKRYHHQGFGKISAQISTLIYKAMVKSLPPIQ